MLGHEVIDGTGQTVGKIVDTLPFDGGEVEIVVVRLGGAFGGTADARRRGPLVSTASACARRSPPGRSRIRPQLSRRPPRGRGPYRARSYWRFAEPETFYAAAA